MKQEAFGSDHPGRTWSLRREWSRAFTVMLVLLLLAASASIVGVWTLVDGVHGTASQLNRESVASSALSTNVVAHEEAAHKILSDETVDRSAFLTEQHVITVQFEAAEKLFPATNGLRASVVAAHRSWQRGLTTFGLWGPAVLALHGNHAVENPIYGAPSDPPRRS